jgi:hypothetical protein
MGYFPLFKTFSSFQIWTIPLVVLKVLSAMVFNIKCYLKVLVVGVMDHIIQIKK